jgi:ATP sulfurylase
MLQDGIEPPAEFSRPEVARILIEDARAQAR